MLLSSLMLFLFSISVIGQNIVGTYKYDYKRKYDLQNVSLEVKILNDSTFIINSYEGNKPNPVSYKKSEESGRIKKVKKNHFIFSQYDSVAKKDSNLPVKITTRKIIFYGYKSTKVNKLVKAFELKKHRL
jgi:hypothetical protein